ncbi:MAG: tetratricopeptide repeat protein [Bacteroidetes bacterium]|nr:tetratricopeptide repeat protein [Bacteroidota bacterium]
MTKSIYSYLFLLLFYGSFSIAQNAGDNTYKIIDSLKLQLKTAKHDTTKANYLIKIVETLYLKNPDTALIVIAEAEKLSQKSNYKKGIATSYNFIAYIINQKGNIKGALAYYLKSIQIMNAIGDKGGMALTLNNMAGIYKNQGDIKKAIDYVKKSLKIQIDQGRKVNIARSFNNLGFLNGQIGDNEKAVVYFQKALDIFYELKDKQGAATTLNNIGKIYSDNFKKNDSSLSVAMNNFKKSLILAKEIDDQKIIAYVLKNMGDVLIKQNNYVEAEKQLSQSLIIAQKLGYPESIKGAAGALKDVYKKQNKPAQALQMYELYLQMRDSLNNGETRKAALKTQFQYEYDKKEAVLKEQQEKERAVAKEKNQAQKVIIWAVISGLILVLAFLAFVFKRLQITRKQKRIIEKQKQEVEEQKSLVEEKQLEILDSIRYAKRIQQSLLPTEKYITRNLKT